jgi:mannose-6-phosphate isomerase-like protein (cupin superfamily)
MSSENRMVLLSEMCYLRETPHQRHQNPDRRIERRMNQQPRSERPWGYYEVLLEDAEHKVKRIVVYPGSRLSLQRHRHRDEHWLIVSGEAVFTLNTDELILGKGQSIDIPRGALHRVRNTGETDLVIVEVQTGDYFDENDIERVEDDYGRA